MADVLTPEAMARLLSVESVRTQVRRHRLQYAPAAQALTARHCGTILLQLLPYLPREVQTSEELQRVAHTPQFAQALDAFTAALRGGHLNTLLRQFGIDPALASRDDGAPRCGSCCRAGGSTTDTTAAVSAVEAFLQAVGRDAQNRGARKGGGGKDDPSGGAAHGEDS